jgi:hypothetical protein
LFASVRDLGVAARLVAFALGLLLVGTVAALAGAATGDRREPAAEDGAEMAMEEMSSAEQSRASGLVSATAGYTFAPERTTLPRGETTQFRFRIVDEHGDSVRDVDVDGGVRVHLIVVRRDFSGYQHLHPRLEADGSWAVPLELRAPGVYRAFADFEVDGEKTVLGHDLFVPGRFAPTPLPSAGGAATAGAYAVDLSHDPLRQNVATKLRFAISRNGRPVPSFDSYVGHRGHLVALHDGDLLYSHVHPEPDAEVGEIVFHTRLPSAGRYRLFLQFKVDGVVHTAPFTVEVGR